MQNWTPEPEAKAAKVPEDAFVAWLRAEPNVQAKPDFRGIADNEGRLMVVMTHNTDINDSWEREGEDPAFFYQFSPSGYALGIDVLLHAMTH